MKRLIVAFSDSGAGALKAAGLADCVIPLGLRFVSGQLQSPSELARLLAPRSAEHKTSGSHWVDNLGGKRFEEARSLGLGLIEFCERFDAVELWVDPEPNSQLQLIWLLDYLRAHTSVTSTLALIQTSGIDGQLSNEAAARRLQAVPIRNDHLETAAAAWAAWRASTPEAWFDLLARDTSAFPCLRNTVISLLEELP